MKKTNIKQFLLFLLAGISFLQQSCNKTPKQSETELWENLYSVDTREILRIGSDKLDDDKYMFSSINDIRIDASDNIYVLDRRDFRIQKYSPDGKFLKSFVFKKGQGPGEVQNLFMFDVGAASNVFICDDVSGRIASFSEEGIFLEAIKTRIKPIDITVGNDNSVYVCGGSRDISEKIIFRYKLPSEIPISIFCESNKSAQRISTVGIGGALTKDAAGNIIYSFGIPYEIRKFSADGDLINRFLRKSKFTRSINVNEYGLPRADVFIQDICTFPDGKILNVILDRRNKPFIGSSTFQVGKSPIWPAIR